MLVYMADGSDPCSVYPGYWGPFSVVGEGCGLATAGSICTGSKIGAGLLCPSLLPSRKERAFLCVRINATVQAAAAIARQSEGGR
jgi:hypothetical protein